MKRIVFMVTVALVVAAMMVALAMPAFAQEGQISNKAPNMPIRSAPTQD